MLYVDFDHSLELLPALQYLGCFKDNGARDLKYGPKKFGYTPKRCHAACPQFKYFAVQAGSQCFCDNSFGTPSSVYPRVPNGQCGRNRHGSGWRNAVYASSTSVAAQERKQKAQRRSEGIDSLCWFLCIVVCPSS